MFALEDPAAAVNVVENSLGLLSGKDTAGDRAALFAGWYLDVLAAFDDYGLGEGCFAIPPHLSVFCRSDFPPPGPGAGVSR